MVLPHWWYHRNYNYVFIRESPWFGKDLLWKNACYIYSFQEERQGSFVDTINAVCGEFGNCLGHVFEAIQHAKESDIQAKKKKDINSNTMQESSKKNKTINSNEKDEVSKKEEDINSTGMDESPEKENIDLNVMIS